MMKGNMTPTHEECLEIAKHCEGGRLIIEAMARVEFGSDVYIRKSNGISGRLEIVHNPSNAYVPHYPTSHDAVQRVIDGLSNDELCDYDGELSIIVCGISEYEFNPRCYQATALQKCEAILKALGKWTKEME